MDNKYMNSSVFELTTKDFNGTKIINKSFKNNFAVIEIYAPWCPHCISTIDDLKSLATNLNKEGIQFGALNADNPLNKDLISNLGVSSFPTFFMVNVTGKLESVDMGRRSIEEILEAICHKTNEYVGTNIYKKKQKKKTSKCCKREGNNITCA